MSRPPPFWFPPGQQPPPGYHPPQGYYAPQGYHPQGNPQQGYHPQGHPQQGHHLQYPFQQGFPAQPTAVGYSSQPYVPPPVQSPYASSHPPQLYAHDYPSHPYEDDYDPQSYDDESDASAPAPERSSQRRVKDPDGGRHGNKSSGKPAGTEPRRREKKSTGTTRPKSISKHHSDKPAGTDRQRKSTNTADTGGSHSKDHSLNVNFKFKGDDGITVKSHGAPMRIKNNKDETEVAINESENTTGKHGKKKAIGSSRDTRDREQRR